MLTAKVLETLPPPQELTGYRETCRELISSALMEGSLGSGRLANPPWEDGEGPTPGEGSPQSWELG